MPPNLHTHDLVLRLKNARAEKGLTLQEIFDKIEEIGLHVGFTSIKKVFSDGSENFGFRYHDTLEPIEKVLLKQYPDNGDTETAVLKADLAVKEELIEKLERMIGENQTEYRRSIEFLMGQIDGGAAKWEEDAMRSIYGPYKREAKRNGEEPLVFEDWAEDELRSIARLDDDPFAEL